MNLKKFPIALYLRLFGAAGLGFIIGNIDHGDLYTKLVVTSLSLFATLTGWIMMRPLMREAKEAVTPKTRIDQVLEDKRDTTL